MTFDQIMKDFFIYVETTIGPRWIRSTEVTCIEPYDEKSCRITLKNQISYNSVFCELMVQNETADHFLNRLEKQWQIRPTLCQQCKKPGANVLHPLCHQCTEEKAIVSTFSKRECPNDPTHRHFQNFGQGMVCATCHAKAILTDLPNEEKLDAILPPLPKPAPPATQFRTEM